MLQLRLGLFRGGEGHQFHFVELVLADDPLRILSVAARFAPETRGEGAVPQGEPLRRQDFVPIEVRDGDFRRGDQVEGVLTPARLEEIRFELGQLARTVHGLGKHEVGREHFFPTRGTLAVGHEGDEGAFELRAGPSEHGETGTAELGGSVEIQDPQALSQFHVVLGVYEFRRRSPPLEFHVAAFIGSFRHAGMGNVRDACQKVPEGRIGLPLGRLQGLEAFAHVPLRGNEVGGVLLFALESRHLVGDTVALGLQGFRFRDEGPAPCVQGLEFLHGERKPPPTEPGHHRIQILTKPRSIEHGIPFAWNHHATKQKEGAR